MTSYLTKESSDFEKPPLMDMAIGADGLRQLPTHQKVGEHARLLKGKLEDDELVIATVWYPMNSEGGVFIDDDVDEDGIALYSKLGSELGMSPTVLREAAKVAIASKWLEVARKSNTSQQKMMKATRTGKRYITTHPGIANNVELAIMSHRQRVAREVLEEINSLTGVKTEFHPEEAEASLIGINRRIIDLKRQQLDEARAIIQPNVASASNETA